MCSGAGTTKVRENGKASKKELEDSYLFKSQEYKELSAEDKKEYKKSIEDFDEYFAYDKNDFNDIWDQTVNLYRDYYDEDVGDVTFWSLGEALAYTEWTNKARSIMSRMLKNNEIKEKPLTEKEKRELDKATKMAKDVKEAEQWRKEFDRK